MGVYFLQQLFGSHTPVGGMLIVFFSMLALEAINSRPHKFECISYIIHVYVYIYT